MKYLALAFALMFAAPARGQAPARVSAAGAEVSVRFTVVGQENEEAAALDSADIKVTEDGRPLAITGLGRQSGVPLALVIAVDTSASQERILGGTKLAADAFVKGIMKSGADEVGVVTFTGETTLEQQLTNDPAKVREAIARVRFVPPPGYITGRIVVGPPTARDVPRAASTAIWDAVRVVSEQILGRETRAARRALVLVTDGVDTSSRRKLGEAVRGALRAQVVVYAIGIGDRQSAGVDEGALRKLTGRTGGRAFFPKRDGELPGILTQIRSELLSPYVVTFAPPDAKRDGSPRKLKIEIVNPELRRRGLKLSHPEGYFAEKQSSGLRVPKP